MILTIPLCVLNSFSCKAVIHLSVFCWLLSVFVFRYSLVALIPTLLKMSWNKFLLLTEKWSMLRSLLGKDVVLFSSLPGDSSYSVGCFSFSCSFEMFMSSIFVLVTLTPHFQTFCRASVADAARDLNWGAECSAFMGSKPVQQAGSCHILHSNVLSMV